MASNSTLLQTDSLTKYFEGLLAVDKLSLTIAKGEIFGLIGPNGAGKSTVFNLISGVLSPTRGKIIFDNEDITNNRPDKVASKGLVRTFQANVFFPKFTVMENILLGCHLQSEIGVFTDLLNIKSTREKRRKLIETAEGICEFVGLKKYLQESAKNLAHGYQRMLGIAIGLAANPKLIMLDEPVAGMNDKEKTEMMKLINKIREKGTTVLLVEHNMRVVMGICDRVAVINFGSKIAEGTPEAIQRNEDVIEAYLGADQ